MNEINPPREYLARWLGPVLGQALRDHPVVVLTGPRQTGKSTSLRHEEPAASWPHRTLDDLDVLRRARTRPEDLWAGTRNVVLDEVQRAPDLLLAVKAAVDADPERRFVLSGSANLLLMSRVSESLAGRAVYLEMLPMSLGEMEARPRPTLLEDALAGRLPADRVAGSAPDACDAMVRGFLPPLLRLAPGRATVQWWEGYVATYLERDLRQLAQVASLPEFRVMMSVLALRCGQLLNTSEVARDVGLPQATAHRYQRLLEVGGLFHALPAFASNRSQRLVKAPRAMWADPGLASFLAGHHDAESLRASREAGRIFEALVFHHVRCLGQTLTPRPALHAWRTRTGMEVDLVVEQGRRRVAIESKLTASPGYGDLAGLEAFLAAHPNTSAGLLVHGGTAVRRMTDRIVAIPWFVLAGAAG